MNLNGCTIGWGDDTWPRHLTPLNKTSSARNRLHPFESLVKMEPHFQPMSQAIVKASCCFPQPDGNYVAEHDTYLCHRAGKSWADAQLNDSLLLISIWGPRRCFAHYQRRKAITRLIQLQTLWPAAVIYLYMYYCNRGTKDMGVTKHLVVDLWSTLRWNPCLTLLQHSNTWD